MNPDNIFVAVSMVPEWVLPPEDAMEDCQREAIRQKFKQLAFMAGERLKEELSKQLEEA